VDNFVWLQYKYNKTLMLSGQWKFNATTNSVTCTGCLMLVKNTHWKFRRKSSYENTYMSRLPDVPDRISYKASLLSFFWWGGGELYPRLLVYVLRLFCFLLCLTTVSELPVLCSAVGMVIMKGRLVFMMKEIFCNLFLWYCVGIWRDWGTQWRDWLG